MNVHRWHQPQGGGSNPLGLWSTPESPACWHDGARSADLTTCMDCGATRTVAPLRAVCGGCGRNITFVEGFAFRRDYWRIVKRKAA